jgi:hypothetical protein
MDDSLPTNIVTLKLLGFSDAEQERFASMLDQAKRGLKREWHITNKLSAEFFLIKEDLIPQLDQHEVLKNLPRQQCIFIRRKRDEFSGQGHQFYWGENAVPPLRALADFLNGILAGIFDPEQCFLGRLLTPAISARAFTLNNQPDLKLFINAEGTKFYCNEKLEQLAPFVSAWEELVVTELSADEFDEVLAANNLNPQSLNHLLWYAAFKGSKGRVIKGHQSNDLVHLKRWPDINFYGCKRFIKLAAFLHSNTVDLPTAGFKTEMPMEEVYDFYNACKIIGLIEHDNNPKAPEKSVDSEKKRLLSKIGRRLSQVQIATQ